MKSSMLLLFIYLQALVLVWGSKELLQIQDIPTIEFGKVCEYASDSLKYEGFTLTHEEYSIEWSVIIINSGNAEAIAKRNGFTNKGLVMIYNTLQYASYILQSCSRFWRMLTVPRVYSRLY